MTKHGGGDVVYACAPRLLMILPHSTDDCDYLWCHCWRTYWWWEWWLRWDRRLRLRSRSSLCPGSSLLETRSFREDSFASLLRKLKHWKLICPVLPQRLHTILDFCSSFSSSVLEFTSAVMYSVFFLSYIFSSSSFSLRFPEIVSDQIEVVLFAKSPETKLLGLFRGESIARMDTTNDYGECLFCV